MRQFVTAHGCEVLPTSYADRAELHVLLPLDKLQDFRADTAAWSAGTVDVIEGATRQVDVPFSI